MKDLHERSIKSATLTIAGYMQEIRVLLKEDHNLHDCSGGRFSAEELETVAVVLDNMEQIIEKYWEEFSFSKGEIDLKWNVFVLAETMENLVHDMSADLMDRKYGALESAGERAKIAQLQEEVREQIRRLKEISRGKGGPSG